VTSPDSGAAGAGVGGRQLLVMIGAVGAGKGTQAGIIGERLALPHLATGDLFRRALREGTPLGKQAQAYMDRGELVPDDVTITMFMNELADPTAERGAVLDGFPRTVAQAKALDRTLAASEERISHAFYIEVPTEELVERVSGRWVCPVDGTPYHVVSDPPRVPGICDKDGTPLVQRDDDKPDVVRARLAKQVPPMLAVVEHYQRAGVLARVDGRQPIEAVTHQILSILGITASAS
jgi:adenylate kinase